MGNNIIIRRKFPDGREDFWDGRFFNSNEAEAKRYRDQKATGPDMRQVGIKYDHLKPFELAGVKTRAVKVTASNRIKELQVEGRKYWVTDKLPGGRRTRRQVC